VTTDGPPVSSSVDHDAHAMAADVLGLLNRRGETLATAESLTGGLVAVALTSIPGSSAVVRGGLVAYATDVKRDVLGVGADLIATHTVTSAEAAGAMAAGAVTLFASTWAVSTTGVAGPERQDNRPVGTVHVGVAGPAGSNSASVTTAEFALTGSREQIRTASVVVALRTLLDRVTQCLIG